MVSANRLLFSSAIVLALACRVAACCSAGSCALSGLVAEESAANQSGVHLLQTVAAASRNRTEKVLNRSDQHTYCWDNWRAIDDSQEGLFYLFHIPKTATCSLKWDMMQAMGRDKLVSTEKCYSFRALRNFAGVLALLREPRSHVVSQYFECSSSEDWPVPKWRRHVPERFEDWVHSWASMQEAGVSGNWDYVRDPFTCYSPVSLQATRYTCSTWQEHPAFINVTEAVDNMMSTEYLGLVEAYQESICLFHAKHTGALPYYCDCSSDAAWGSFDGTEISHGSQPHSISDYSESVVADVDSITYADRVLYRAAVKRFQEEIREVEQQFGTKILCRDLASEPALKYVLAPIDA